MMRFLEGVAFSGILRFAQQFSQWVRRVSAFLWKHSPAKQVHGAFTSSSSPFASFASFASLAATFAPFHAAVQILFKCPFLPQLSHDLSSDRHELFRCLVFPQHRHFGHPGGAGGGGESRVRAAFPPAVPFPLSPFPPFPPALPPFTCLLLVFSSFSMLSISRCIRCVHADMFCVLNCIWLTPPLPLSSRRWSKIRRAYCTNT